VTQGIISRRRRHGRTSLAAALASVAAHNPIESLEGRLLLSSAVKKPVTPLLKTPKPASTALDLLPDKQTIKAAIASGKSKLTVPVGGGSSSILNGAPPPTVTVGPVVNITHQTGNQAEMEIAINRANPQQLYSVWNGAGSIWGAWSADGGATWTLNNPFAGMAASCCDNVIDFDQYGNLYIAYLNSSVSALVVGRSTNGGQTFTQIHSTSPGSLDNPAINITGNQIIVHTRATGNAGTIFATSSGLGVTSAFTAYQASPGSTGGAYGDAVVGIDGSWWNAYQSSAGGQGPNVIRIHRDPDGPGPSPYSADLANFPCNVGGFDFIPAQNGRSIDAEIQLAVAPAGSTFAGRVYALYTDETVNENNDTNIYVRYTDNNGVNWSAPIKVNDDNTTRSQFLGKIAVDPTSGALAAAWYDCRNDNGVLPNGTNGIQNDDAQIWGAVSLDGGVSWAPNFAIQTGWSNAASAGSGVDYGDWAGMDFYNGNFWYVWSDNSTSVTPANPDRPRLDICTAKVHVDVTPVTGIFGTVFNDANANGAIDAGDQPLAGATVYLDLDHTGTLTPGDQSVVTNNGGQYAFTGLTPNVAYTVLQNPPAGGYRQTLPASGGYTITLQQDQQSQNNNFADTNAVLLGGTVYRDVNGNGTRDFGEGGISGATVYLDANNNGQFDNTIVNQASTDVPKAIPDLQTITSNNVINLAGTVTKVTVTLDLTHTYDGDLVLTLISPAGTRVILSNRRGGSGDNFTNTTFDDNGSTPIASGTAPFTGTFIPDQPLATVNGESANGTWKLEVSDQASGDFGTLNSWSLNIRSVETNTTTNAAGQYSFGAVSAGNYKVRVVAPPGYVFSGPANGLNDVNANPGDIVSANFGLFPVAYTGSDMYLRLDPTGTNVQVWIDTATSNPPTYTAPKALITAPMTFTSTASNDQLTIDYDFGNPVAASGVAFDGGGGTADRLRILGDSGAAETATFNAGNAVVNGSTITETNVERVTFDGNGGDDSVAVNGGPTVEFPATQHLAVLNIASGAGASVVQGANAVLVTKDLTVAGLLDLNDNDMIFDYRGSAQLPAVQLLINAARNGGAWDGTSGITSTTARNNAQHNTTLGAMEATDYATVHGGPFDGETLDGTAVVVKYTYYGDTDFNGVVNFDDYVRTDNGFNNHLTGWPNGDFNGDGQVNFDDYVLIDLAFSTQVGPL
jgi:subtilisin-like proprotein convertase family protein